MKTKNNVQKTITKTLAAGMSLVLISITVSAQDFWKSFAENSGLNAIATAMAEPVPETTKNETYNVSSADLTAFMEETEEPMELENWMMDDHTFSASFSIESETEKPLALEDWMTNENTFNTSNFVMEEESEEALSLESWMTSESYFGISTFKLVDEKEQPLALAGWMTSEKIW